MKHYSRNGVPVKKVNAEAKIIHVHTNCAEWYNDHPPLSLKFVISLLLYAVLS